MLTAKREGMSIPAAARAPMKRMSLRPDGFRVSDNGVPHDHDLVRGDAFDRFFQRLDVFPQLVVVNLSLDK